MSTKDLNFYRFCPICNDKLVGSDDGLEVFQSLEDQLEDPSIADEDPCCTLCGEDCPRAEATQLVAAGEPTLYFSNGNVVPQEQKDRMYGRS